MYDFAYEKPASLADAVAALGHEDAKVIAGGMTLIPVLKQRLTKPSVVVDLSGLGMTGITVTDESVIIGAMTTHATVAASAAVKHAIPALATLAGLFGARLLAARVPGCFGGSGGGAHALSQVQPGGG